MVKWIPYFIHMTSLVFWLKAESQRISRLTNWQIFTIFSALVYVLAVSYLTLAPTSYAFSGVQQVAPIMFGNVPMNLVPFLSSSIDYYQNILMLMPFGVYLTLLRPHWRPKNIFLAGLFVSTGIEFLQFILDWFINLSRWVDINDIITNTLGVLVGWTIMQVLKKTKLNKLIRKFTIDFKLLN